jgi:hypothetical protein
VVPTLIIDGNVGTAHNSCQIDIRCQSLQAWEHLVGRARYAQADQKQKNVGNNMSGEVDHLSPESS